jgi:hypothetical protein
VLPFIYPGRNIQQMLEDIDATDIPDIHKLMFAWVKQFTTSSSNLTHGDTKRLAEAGIPDRDIVEWANVASTQTWFVMSADGGGIPLEGNDLVGSVLGQERAAYHQSEVETARGGSPASGKPDGDHTNWVTTDRDKLGSISAWANDQFGFVPNLFEVTSLAPHYFPRHKLAIELLSAPQSASLSPRLHAMVRRLVNRRNDGEYFEATTRKQITSHDPAVVQVLDNESDFAGLEELDRTVLEFADKLVRHAYKVTEKDAQTFRDCGLDDEAYIDVLNTVSIQTSLDRLCNSLGIQPDDGSLITSG